MTTPLTAVQRWRMVAVSGALVALAFVQAPDRILNDTKIDLALAPGRFLERALSLWDPAGSFGQVQNQAYGYLFPMGPFFWLGDLLAAPPWVVQRAWWALLLVLGFWGVVTLARVLGIGTHGTQMLGALAYVLSPRILTVIGPSSVEVWPMATAPWVLVALAIGLTRGDPRRWAAAAALAVAATGGVNAAATAAVLPLGVLLVLLADPGPRRRALMLWWPALTIVATAWWWIPLLLLGRVSPPFLDFIESATTTTFAAHPFDALRGTTNWLPYLDGTQVAGNALVTEPLLILNGTLVLALGVWGLARRDVPHRSWLVGGTLLGLVLVTAGQADGGWGSGTVAGWLDGALAPLRNTHKFDLVLRIPLVLGLVHLVARAQPVTVRGLRVSGVAVLAVASLASATTPAWTAELPRTGGFVSVPGYWDDATRWMTANTSGENTLVLPGSAFGDYLWGRPRDELVQALGTTPWSLRNAVPLVPPGAIRSLDALEEAFASGRGSPALADLLRRSGIRYLLVRNDLAETGATDPELVYSTLSSTPGVQRRAGFGPRVGSPASQETDEGETVFVNGGRQSRHRAVEVFEVAETSASTARSQQADATPVVVGSPAAQLLGLLPAGVDVLMARDVPDTLTPRQVVLTDTDRRQEVAFGRVVDNRSASLARTDPYRIERPVHDYVTGDDEAWQTVPELEGARDVAVSSSASDVTQGRIDQTAAPWAALDGDPSTAWTAGDLDGWLEVRYGRAVSTEGATVTLPRGAEPRTVEVRTDRGVQTLRLRPGRPASIDAGTTRTLRIGLPRPDLDPLSLAEVDVPRAPLSRPLRLPDLPEAWGTPTDVVLTADPGDASCWRVEGVTRCVPGRDGRGEDASMLDRVVPMGAGAVFASGMSVLPVNGTDLQRLLAGPVEPTTSSSASSDPAAGPLAMVDGDPQTGWVASLGDSDPTITLRLDEDAEVSRIRLRTDPTLAASAPRRGVVELDDGARQRVRFDVDGLAELERPGDARLVKVTVTDVYVRSTLGFDGSGSGLPVGVSEVSLPGSGIDPAEGAATTVDLPCGSGPDLRVNGARYPTSVRGSRAAVAARAELPATVCEDGGSIALQEGDNRIVVRGSEAFRPTLLRLSQGPRADAAGSESAIGRNGSGTLRVDDLGEGTERLVAVPQTANPGWTADDATAVTVNGWMQGWITDRGSVQASFGAGTVYRLGLALGAVSVLGLVLWWWRSSPRGAPGSAARPRPRRRLRATVLGLATVVSVGLLGGWTGLAAAGVGAVVTGLLRGRGTWVAPLAVTAAGTGYVLAPWGSAGGWAGAEAWPQLLVLLAVGALVGTVVPRPRSLSRIAGLSTSR